MKVAYNKCFGGFGLSSLALTKYAEKKGITLTWYVDGVSIEGVPDSSVSSFGMHPYTENHGHTLDGSEGDTYYSPDFYDEARSDTDLIEVIEELGEKANGFCASLAIKEIPDGASFEIDEYDGNETVVPPRQSW